MADGGAPHVNGSTRTAAQENHWSALVVSRQTLLEAGINLGRQLRVLTPRKQCASEREGCSCMQPGCGACARQHRTREARVAAAEVRELISEAPQWERLIYERRGLYEVPVATHTLDRPPRETRRGGVIVCQDPAPSYGRDHRSEPECQDEHGRDNGVRYPMLSDYTTKAALFDLVDWRKLGAESTDEIAFSASWLGTPDGFRRVDPFWTQRRRDAERQQYRDHLERDRYGRALLRPMALSVLLRDFAPEHHDVVRFVHSIVTQYCEPAEGVGLSRWALCVPAAWRPEAYAIYRTCTPRLKAGGGRRTMPTLIDNILQHGFREIVPPYIRSSRPEVARASAIADRWLQRTETTETPRLRGEPTSPAALTRADHWPTLPGSIAASHRERLVLNLHREMCAVTDGTCLTCALRK